MGKLISQIGENLSFVLECLGIFAALFVLALLFERFVMKTAKSSAVRISSPTRRSSPQWRAF